MSSLSMSSKAQQPSAAPAAAVLELEQCIGFSGDVRNGLYLHPDNRYFLKPVGANIVLNPLAPGSSADSSDGEQSFLRGHDGKVSCVAMSRTGQYLATGQVGGHADVVVWDYASRKELFRFAEHRHGIADVSFSYCERFLATVGDQHDRHMYIWDLHTGMIVTMAGIGPTDCVRWAGRVKNIKKRPTKQYQLITSSYHDESIVFWTLDPATGDMRPQKATAIAHQRKYSCMDVSWDEEYLFAGSGSGDITVFSVRHRKMLLVVRVCSGGVHAVLAGPKGDFFVGGGDGSLVRFSWIGKEYVAINRVQLPDSVTSISLSSDAVELMVGTLNGNIYRVRCKDFKAVLISENHVQPITAVSFQEDVSDKFITVADGGAVRVWDTALYKVLVRSGRPSGRPECVVMSDDVIITGWADGHIRSYHPKTGEKLWNIANAHKDGVSAMSLSRNEKFMVTAGEHGEVRVWELRTRELICTLKEHKLRVTGLILFDDNSHVVSVARDRSILSWDLHNEQRMSAHKNLGSVNGVALAPDQTTIATAGQDSMCVWDLRKVQPLVTVNRPHDGETTCVAIARTLPVVATGGEDGYVCLWHLHTGEQLSGSGHVHSSTVNSLSFSADDQQLVSVGADGVIGIWNVFLATK